LWDLVGGISRKFEVRQPHTLIHNLIRSDICGRFESFGAAAGHIVVLIHAVADLAQPKPISSALIPIEDARNVYVARAYAYVSAGKQGLAIVDVEKPDAPKLDQIFTAEGQLNDVNDVKIGMVLSPWDDPGHFSGFSPRPTPNYKLIATAHTHTVPR
jgi:hypothetical protein